MSQKNRIREERIVRNSAFINDIPTTVVPIVEW